MRSMHVVASHANRRRARSMTLAPSTTFGCSFVPSENLIGTTNSFTLDTCNISPSFVMSSANKTEPVNSSREQIAEEYTDTIELSAPFRLLLVNKRFADIAVRSLWEGIVFHGHDAYQVRTLLSTLRDDKYPLTSTRSVVSQSIVADFDHINEDIYQSTSTSALLAFLDENNPVQPCSDLINSVQQSVKRFEGIINQVPSEENIQQPHALTRKSHSHSYYLGPARRHSISGAESTFLETRMLSLPSIISKSPPQYLAPRWSYRQLPRNVVLNFAHPQASPQLLVEVLECIGSYCRDQIKALDLRANEKMQAAGLEVSSELERLFGSGFSNLEYLRLQGGFVDNQLLSALTKGIISSSVALPTKETNSQKIHHQQHRGPGAFPLMSPPCRLSQVFLGPGSVTDSAIAKLIAATSYCLEVFTVTSCVDVGGGALASLLTECQRLRVLAVHKSLARDVELLEGLGYDTNVTPALSNPSGITLSSDPMKSPRKKIVAPLERLELGTVQLTTIGIAEIIKGTSDTLRFIVIETRHFKGSLLKDVIMPMCKKLVGLYFDDPDHYYLYQLQQYRMHRRQPQLHDSCRQSIRLPFSRADSGQAMESEYHHPNSNRRLFKLRRSRTSTAEPRSQSQHSHNLRKDNTITHDEESNSQMHNLWLGKTSTAEWIEYGSCALWAAGVVGVASGYEVNGVHSISNGNGRAAAHSHSTSGSRNRSVSSFFRGIGTRLVSAFSPRRNHNYNGNSINHESVNTSEDTTTILIDHEREINMILARHGVEAAVIDSLCKALVPTLRFFVVMQSDLMPTLSQSPDS
ncbi:hypothetical protein FBU30_011025 [Linnemannia zychae]|nr:hypothetical protein FBU30_011025 [Linnemannia zychae]